MECPVCNELVWRYDMGKHMSLKHPGQDCPPEAIVSAAEKEIINKKSKNSKKIWRFPIFRNYLMTRWSYFHWKISGTVRKRSGQRANTELSRGSKVREWSAFSANKTSFESNSSILPTWTLTLLTTWNDCKDSFFDNKLPSKMKGC